MRNSGPRNSFAVATTVADSTLNVELFVDYHLQIGANFVFVFLDDNNDETFARLEHKNRVRVFKTSAEHRENWQLVTVREDAIYKKDTDTEVMYRQCLNLGVASAYARHYGIDWLFHLDGDELIYGNGHDLGSFLGSLRSRGVGSCRMINYECIPNADEETHHFEACKNFKINKFLLYGYEEARFTYSKEEMDFFRKTDWMQSKYFNFYANGKGATFLGEEFELLGVHSTVPKKALFYYGKRDDPLILHYACATFEEFKQKYRRLGDFTEYWFSDYMHLKSKSVLSRRDDDEAKYFYEKYMALGPERTELLKKLGLAIQIDEPSKVVSTLLKNRKESNKKTEKIKAPENKHNGALEREVLTIDLCDIACQADAQMVFQSMGLAKRWIRRNINKSVFRSHELIELSSGVVQVILDQKKCFSFQNADVLQRAAMRIADCSREARCVELRSLEWNFLQNFEGLTRNEIVASQYRIAGELSNLIKKLRKDIVIVLNVELFDPVSIPLLEKGKVDFVRPRVCSIEIKNHSKLLF